MSHTVFSSGSALWRPLSGVHFQCAMGALNLLHPSMQATCEQSFLQRTPTLNRNGEAHPQHPGCVLSVKNLDYQIWVCGSRMAALQLHPIFPKLPSLVTDKQSRLGENSVSCPGHTCRSHIYKKELSLRPEFGFALALCLCSLVSVECLTGHGWIFYELTYSSFYKCSSEVDLPDVDWWKHSC